MANGVSGRLLVLLEDIKQYQHCLLGIGNTIVDIMCVTVPPSQ